MTGPHELRPRPRTTWRQVHEESAPLLLPAAHDALTAKVIRQAGFPAFEIGGLALVGSASANRTSTFRFGENGRGGSQTDRGLFTYGTVDAADTAT